MRLDLKGRIAKVFNRIIRWWCWWCCTEGQHGTVMEDVTSGLDVSAHTVSFISQSHYLEVGVETSWVQCANG